MTAAQEATGGAGEARTVTLSEELAGFVLAARWDRLPPAVQQRTRLRLADILGLCLAGLVEPFGQAARRLVLGQGGAAQATLVTGERLPAAQVALAHGILAHGLDYDDTHHESVVHPSSVVVPVALAVGERAAAPGAEVLAAIAAGVEVFCRLGAAAGRRFHARGLHASAVLGPVAAALVAGRLLGLDRRRCADAAGLAGSMGGGLLEFLSDGSWSKRLHPGWAAHGGILAAELAAGEFPGPATVLEGRYGLYRALLGDVAADLSRVTAALGARWESEQASFKLYPCAHVMHPFLDGVLHLRRSFGLAPGQVDAVECKVAPWQVPLFCEPRAEKLAPANGYQASTSLPVVVASALLDGQVGLDSFSAAAIRRPELLALAARVRCLPEPGEDGPQFRAAVAIHLAGGRTVTHRADSAGAQDVGAAVAAKFRQTAGRALPAAAVEQLWRAAMSLETGTVTQLLAQCRAETGA